MALAESLDLLTDIKEGSDEYEHAIFGTYTFEPAFFEGRILSILQKHDTENILVLIDASEYAQRFTEVRSAGREYYLDYCTCARTFHPKFVLLTWPEGGKLLIGSANLTEDAWMTAAELLVSLEFNVAEPDPDVHAVFWQMKKFMEDLLFENLLQSSKHRAKVEEALSQTRWLAELEEKKPSSRIRLLHNLKTPILEQVFDQIGEEEIREISLLSPFFDPKDTVLDKLLKSGCKSLTLYIQPDEVFGFPKKDVLRARKNGMKIRVVAIRFKEQETRYIHAKLLLIKTNRKAYCVFGSANATEAGLLCTAKNGNVELCMLRAERDRSYFDYLLDSRVLEFKEIGLDKVEVRPMKLPSMPRPRIPIIDAHLEGQDLVIELKEAYREADHAEIQLRHGENETPIELQQELENGRIVRVKMDEKTFAFCSEPTYVSLSISVKGKILNSDRRWISTQALELVPRRRDLQRIKDTNGRFGLITMFNQLYKAAESPEWFLYYIQKVDFEDLAENLDWVRRQLMKRADIPEEGASELPPRPTIDARTILMKIMNRHRKRFEKQIAEVKANRKLPVVLERLFDVFMFLSKTTLWFVLNELSEIQELRHIRESCLEKLSELLQKLKTDAPKRAQQQLSSIVQNLQIPPHFILLCFIIDDLHQRTGYAIRDPIVVDVFRQTYARVLRPLCTDIGKPRPFEGWEKQLAEAIREYEEFENLRFDLEQVIQFAGNAVRRGVSNNEQGTVFLEDNTAVPDHVSEL